MHVKSENKSFGKIKLEKECLSNIDINSNIIENEDYILLKYSENPDICEIKNDNIHNNKISCIGHRKGKTQIHNMLIYTNGNVTETITKDIDIIVE